MLFERTNSFSTTGSNKTIPVKFSDILVLCIITAYLVYLQVVILLFHSNCISTASATVTFSAIISPVL